AMQIHGAAFTSHRASQVPRTRNNPNGSHQMRSLKTQIMPSRRGHSSLKDVTMPIGPKTLPKKPTAIITHAASSSFQAAYQYRKPYTPTTIPKQAQIPG